MRVPGVGNNPGYGRGPQAEKTNKDAPRKQQQHEQPGGKRDQQQEQDSVELNPPGKGKAGPDVRAKGGPINKPAGGRPPLDISG